eukprot:XP_028343988.1 uncharacterized protein LOC114486064 [Physeter catodon]
MESKKPKGQRIMKRKSNISTQIKGKDRRGEKTGVGENVALIILRLRLLKEGAVLSESLLSQVRRSLSLFKGPLEIKLPKTNPGDHSGSCGGGGGSNRRRRRRRRRRRKAGAAAALRRGWAPRSWTPRSSHSLSNQPRRKVVERPRCPLAALHTDTGAPRVRGSAALQKFLLGSCLSPPWTSERFGIEAGKAEEPQGSRKHHRLPLEAGSGAALSRRAPSSLGREATRASGCVTAVAGRLDQRHAKLQVRQGDRRGEQERRQPGAQQQPEEGRQQAGAAHLPGPLLPLHGVGMKLRQTQTDGKVKQD